jgi:hypothetical protein
MRDTAKAGEHGSGVPLNPPIAALYAPHLQHAVECVGEEQHPQQATRELAPSWPGKTTSRQRPACPANKHPHCCQREMQPSLPQPLMVRIAAAPQAARIPDRNSFICWLNCSERSASSAEAERTCDAAAPVCAAPAVTPSALWVTS